MPSRAIDMAHAVSAAQGSIVLRTVRADYSRARGSGRAWLGIDVGELSFNGILYTGLNAHISLAYAWASAAERIEELAASLTGRLAALMAKRDFVHFRAVVSPPHELSGPNYAWCDINVGSSMHSALCSLSHQLLSLQPGRRNWSTKTEYHISFSTIADEQADDREAMELEDAAP